MNQVLGLKGPRQYPGPGKDTKVSLTECPLVARQGPPAPCLT